MPVPMYGAAPVRMLNVAVNMPDPVGDNHYYDNYGYGY